MVDKGFSVFPPDPPIIPDSAAQSSLPPTLSVARVHGYGFVSAESSDAASIEDSAWAGSSDDYKQRYTRAEMGDDSKVVTYDFGDGVVSAPADGCHGQTSARVRGDVKQSVRLEWIAGNEVRTTVDAAAQNDPRLSAATTRWATCMKGKGVDIRSRAEIGERLPVLYSDGVGQDAARLKKAKAAEVALAVKDAECADTSTLRSTSLDVKAAAATAVLTKHEKDLVAWRQMVQSALVRAEQLLKAG